MGQVSVHALLAGAGAIPRKGLAGGIATCMILLHRQGDDHAAAALTARLVDRGGLTAAMQGDDNDEAESCIASCAATAVPGSTCFHAAVALCQAP